VHQPPTTTNNHQQPHYITTSQAAATGSDDEEGEGEEEKMGLWASIVGLVVITAVVAVFSEFLVASIDDVCSTYNISKARAFFKNLFGGGGRGLCFWGGG
jgi:Ca2+/H+ antiporter